MRDKRIARRLSLPINLPLAPRYYSRLCVSGLSETMGLRPMDAIVTRRCPICGQKMEINEPRDFARALREHTKSAHPTYYAQTRRMRKMIAPMLVAIVVLGFTPIIFESALGYALAAPLSIAGFIAPLVVVGAIGRQALKTAQQAGTRTNFVVPEGTSTFPTEASQASASYAGQDIVRITKDLAGRLEISGFEPESVSWQDYFVRSGFSFKRSNRPIMVPYDGCMFVGKQMILPESTKDKLQPEEWAPLIASELIYQRILLEKRRLGLLIRILPLTAVYIIIPVILWQLGILNLQGTTTVRGAPTPVVVAFFQLYSGTALIFAMVLYIILGLRFNSRMRLKSDALAAELTGKTAFISALQKIGTAFPKLMTTGRAGLEDIPKDPNSSRGRSNSSYSRVCVHPTPPADRLQLPRLFTKRDFNRYWILSSWHRSSLVG